MERMLSLREVAPKRWYEGYFGMADVAVSPCCTQRNMDVVNFPNQPRSFALCRSAEVAACAPVVPEPQQQRTMLHERQELPLLSQESFQ